MPEIDKYDLPPAWRSAAETIMNLIDGGEMLELAKTLPEGPASKYGMENYAREYCKVRTNADLSIIYAILGVTTCVAAQGGYVVQVPLSEGGVLTIPAILFVMGIAPSGWGKSTALDVGMKPLLLALRSGKRERLDLMIQMREAATAAFEAAQTDDLLANQEQFRYVYDAGLCPKTLTEDATQEAMRDQCVVNGGHVAAVAGEPDILRNVGAYSKSGEGSLTLLLSLWDQRGIDTTRVSNPDLFIAEASLAMCILFQTGVFAEVTSGNAHGMGSGADNYTKRGVFGRTWVVETNKTDDWVETARKYSDDNDFEVDPADPTGFGLDTPLAAACTDFEINLSQLQTDTNQYRMEKAIHRQWDLATRKYGSELQVPEPPEGDRHVILLDADGRLAYRRLQRMMQCISNHVHNSEDEEARELWSPTASRITQHVLREALVMSLAAGRREVTAEFIEDAATRILPWRWCLSANALTIRSLERAELVMADAVLNTNPQQRDITPAALIRDVLLQLAKDDSTLAAKGLPISKLRDKVKSRLPANKRHSINTLLKNALEELTADPTSGIQQVDGPKNAAGASAVYYRVPGSVSLP
jgi:hypothetical protein